MTSSWMHRARMRAVQPGGYRSQGLHPPERRYMVSAARAFVSGSNSWLAFVTPMSFSHDRCAHQLIWNRPTQHQLQLAGFRWLSRFAIATARARSFSGKTFLIAAAACARD